MHSTFSSVHLLKVCDLITYACTAWSVYNRIRSPCGGSKTLLAQACFATLSFVQHSRKYAHRSMKIVTMASNHRVSSGTWVCFAKREVRAQTAAARFPSSDSNAALAKATHVVTQFSGKTSRLPTFPRVHGNYRNYCLRLRCIIPVPVRWLREITF